MSPRPPAAGRPRLILATAAALLGVTAAGAEPLEVPSPALPLPDPGRGLEALAATLTQAPAALDAALAALTAAWANGEVLRIVVRLLILVVAAGGLEVLWWCYAGRLLRVIGARRPDTVPAIARQAVERAALQLTGLGLSTALALVLAQAIGWAQPVPDLLTVVALGVAAPRLAVIVEALLLAPTAPHLHWLALEVGLRRALAWTLVLGVAAWALALAAAWVLEHLAAAPALARLAEVAAVLVTVGMLLLLRPARALGPLAVPGARRLAAFAFALMVLAWAAAWLLGARALAATAVVLALLLVGDHLARRIFATLTPPPRPVLRRLVRIAMVVAGLGALLVLWGVDLAAVVAGTHPRAALLRAVTEVLLVALLADLAWVWLSAWIERRLSQPLVVVAGAEAVTSAPPSRLASLLPVARRFVGATLVVLVALITLSAIGIDIGPLLAGAGIVGLAVGFGAQTLVRDIITGVFFLLEDAFRVGEYIDVGDKVGQVEALSLRSLRLRHHRGAIHTVPYSEIRTVSNHSRDWVIVKMEFTVPFDTNIELLRRIIKKVGQEMTQDPQLAPHILEPLKSQGVKEMSDHLLVIRMKFKARPNENQFIIRREAYQRVQAALEANDISLGQRRVQVEVIDRKAQPDTGVAGAAGDMAAA